MSYSDQFGLSTHINKVYTFGGIHSQWLQINGLAKDDLKEIDPNFLGLPVVVSVPILTIEENEDNVPRLQLKLHKTKWYGTSITPYLISPQEGSNPALSWIIKYTEKYDPVYQELSLWQGKIGADEEEITLSSKIFSLPYTTDVEKLLSCYFQLLEINKVQILDLWSV